MTGSWIEIARATSPDGDELILRQRGAEFELRMNGWQLMTSRAYRSEQTMAALACDRLPPASRILVGGLGMGYTLRAVLDRAPPDATILLVELIPEAVMWNRGPIAPLAGRPLDDPRTTTIIADVATILRRSQTEFDAILLDIDNGPDARVRPSNASLSSLDGLRMTTAALRPDGVLAVWSAEPSLAFEAVLAAAGLAHHSVVVPVSPSSAVTHTIYLGRKAPISG